MKFLQIAILENVLIALDFSFKNAFRVTRLSVISPNLSLKYSWWLAKRKMHIFSQNKIGGKNPSRTQWLRNRVDRIVETFQWNRRWMGRIEQNYQKLINTCLSTESRTSLLVLKKVRSYSTPFLLADSRSDIQGTNQPGMRAPRTRLQ